MSKKKEGEREKAALRSSPRVEESEKGEKRNRRKRKGERRVELLRVVVTFPFEIRLCTYGFSECGTP